MSRGQYFLYSMVWIVAGSVLRGLIILVEPDPLGNPGFLSLAFAPYFIAASISLLSYSARRLNDLNRPRYWLLFFLIPFLNLGLQLILLFAPGQDPSEAH